MNRFKLYGIGNALLDYEYLVDDSILEELEIEKGTMLLNEHEKHVKIHNLLKKKYNSQKIMPGGSVANSVYSMAKFGNKVCFAGKVSTDETGKKFISSIEEAGIHSDVCKVDSDISGECLVLITSDNERTMNTYLGSSSKLYPSDISTDLIKDSEYLLIEGYLVSSDQTLNVCKSAVEFAKKNQTKVLLTLSDPNIVKYFRDNILTLLEDKIDFIFCNELEAKYFSQTNTIKDALVTLKSFAHKVIVTLGDKGAIYTDDTLDHKVNGINVESNDFTGAGDMFLGAFMHKFESQKNASESLIFANKCASEIIKSFGAKFEKDSEYQSLINR